MRQQVEGDGDEEEQRLLVRAGTDLEVTIGCQDVSLTVGEGDAEFCALSNVTACLASGELCGILGPSGAGKTSFLNVVGGRALATKGDLRVNGQEMSTLKNWESHCGFVAQSDHLPAYLTVEEYFEFCCNLRCHGLQQSSRKKMVDSVIKQLSLEKVCRKRTRIGSDVDKKLSGGEIRRVSIGAELLRADQVRALLLDEPLSGLDSQSALQIIDVLKSIAEEGRVVALSLHQPSSLLFSKLSKIILLDKTGRVCFFGTPGEAQTYFDETSMDHSSLVAVNDDDAKGDQDGAQPIKMSIPEVMLDVASNASDSTISVSSMSKNFWDSQIGKCRIEEVNAALCTSRSTLDDVLKDQRGDPCCCLCCARSDVGPFAVQVRALAVRAMRRHWRNGLMFKMHVAMTVIAAFVMSALWSGTGTKKDLQGLHNRMGILFFIVCFLGFSSLSALGTFISEREMFMRERKGRMYSPTVYFLVEVFMDFVFLRMLPPLLLGSIVYWPTGLRTGSSLYFFIFQLLLIMGNVGFTSASMFMSAASPSMPIATFSGALFMLLFLAFGGIFLSIDSLPIYFKWMPYLTPSHFAYDGLVRNELTGQEFKVSSGSKVPGLGEVGALIPGKTILQQMGFGAANLAVDVAGLFLVPMLYCLLAWAFLQRNHRL